jgi:hypothetical protein
VIYANLTSGLVRISYFHWNDLLIHITVLAQNLLRAGRKIMPLLVELQRLRINGKGLLLGRNASGNLLMSIQGGLPHSEYLHQASSWRKEESCACLDLWRRFVLLRYFYATH